MQLVSVSLSSFMCSKHKKGLFLKVVKNVVFERVNANKYVLKQNIV